MESKSKGGKRCSRCKAEAVTELAYAGEYLCGRCFKEFFERRVRKTIRTNRLLDGRDKAAVALSGGKDSAVVLYLLSEISKNRPNFELSAISIDQGMGDFQEKSMDAAKKLCKTLGVTHHIYSFKKEFGITMDDIVKKARTLKRPSNACTYCGVLRRSLLNEKARLLGSTKIATGHNMDDEIEAGMMNYIRGDLDRMARMGAYVGSVRDARFVPRIKPLRDSPENEVRLYARLTGLPYDSSRCPYSCDSYRKTVREVIETIEGRHLASKFQMRKSIDRLIELTRKEKGGRIGICSRCGEATSQETCKFCEIKKIFSIS